MQLVWSDGLLARSRRVREEVAARLAGLGVDGELRLTGAAGMAGVLTRGDVDLHLRVPAERYADTVHALRAALPTGSPHAWAATLAVFDVPGGVPTGLAVTPVGSEHDVRFLTTWQRLAQDPALLAELNRVKARADGTPDYEQVKAAFFEALSGR